MRAPIPSMPLVAISLLATSLLGAVLAATMSCSGDKSLGGGLPGVDGAAADQDARDDARDASRAGSCGARPAIDAGHEPGAGLVAWYRCEASAAPGAPLLDSSTYRNDASPMSGAGDLPGHRFVPGKVGGAVELLHDQQGYVALPAGLLTDACEATIAAWVYINSNVNAWTRIWDFGQSTSAYMFLTPITNTTGSARFGISVKGNSDEEVIDAHSAVPTLKWTHVAVVLGPDGGTLYFDGSPVGTNTAMSLRPADLGRTAHNYIGRSQFSDDPYLDAAMDEIRVYHRALSAGEIRALVDAP